ncbi:hypothetical protein PoMZ_07197 [Pyricularia oryzae]|uniref:Uncharacterized protein n=1 Tax=Pyricularia oryzae TaxID=318829 RepID=A0A4V1C6L0_PYROR|nr:hypothetical protein PoMZ_07197 [Pyricularia oryzae]
MAITSLDTLPVELLMHIAGYVAAPLFELRSNRRKSWPVTWWRADLLRSRTPSTPLTYSLVCRTTYNTVNPCLYQSAARWKDLSMPESAVPIRPSTSSSPQAWSAILDPANEKSPNQLIGKSKLLTAQPGINHPEAALDWAGRYRPVSVRPVNQRIRRWTKKTGVPQSAPKAVLPKDHLYFRPNGNGDDSDSEHASCNFMFRSPLHVAASLGNLEALKRFLDVGFSPNALSNGHCACLRLAAGSLVHGLSPSSANEELLSSRVKAPCWTPLHAAICHGEWDHHKVHLGSLRSIWRQDLET